MNTTAVNHLANETSPYLLQHAHNPVDWYAWCDEALDKARREDKLILLSIGYSACHWCHVMAHESFEDAELALLMNKLFVCIKVDREERPDVDKIYQLAHQLMSRRAGGWPLTAFLTPRHHTPIFIGTYLPPTARHGLPSFSDVMQQVEGYYREHRHHLAEHHQAIVQALAHVEPKPLEVAEVALTVNEQVLSEATHEAQRQYDARHGGFGGAPKFPHATMIDFCLRQATRTQRTQEISLSPSLSSSISSSPRPLYDLALHSLQAMAAGGINDQLGGGFYRYTVDAQWAIPHFEKMLYDNALLLPLYADAALLSGELSGECDGHSDGVPEEASDPHRDRARDDGGNDAGDEKNNASLNSFAEVAHACARWVMNEMQSASGGYYSSLDADSDDGEGAYYVWEVAELKKILTQAEWNLIQTLFGLHGTPNFEGRWHFARQNSLSSAVPACNLTIGDADALWQGARAKLFAVRQQRVRPACDDKVLSAWNALMVRGLAHAGGVLGCAAYLHSAERARDHLHKTAWRDGKLLATSRHGTAHLPAYLDDYAFLADALLELLQWRWRADDLAWALQLATTLLARFQDAQHGAFYFTSDDHETLLHRHKPTTDDATPSGNGIALSVLTKLYYLTGDAEYGKAVEAGWRALWSSVVRYPFAHGALLGALQEYLTPGRTIILRGAPDDLAEWHRLAHTTYRPFDLCLAIPNEVVNLPGLLDARKPHPNGAPLAYICNGLQCEAPLLSLQALQHALRE